MEPEKESGCGFPEYAGMTVIAFSLLYLLFGNPSAHLMARGIGVAIFMFIAMLVMLLRDN